jgi:Domain of unknown function (DUF1830)
MPLFFAITSMRRISFRFFEQAVLPGGQLLFEAPAQSSLEIYTSGIATAILEEIIACDRLRIQPNRTSTMNSLPIIQVQNVQLCA